MFIASQVSTQFKESTISYWQKFSKDSQFKENMQQQTDFTSHEVADTLSQLKLYSVIPLLKALKKRK